MDGNGFIDEHFSDKVIICKNYDNLKNKIKKYIDNKDLRSTIVKKCYQK